MYKLIFEIGVLAATVAQSPQWGTKDFQQPYIKAESYLTENVYFSVNNSARTNAKRLNLLDPLTTVWTTEVGYKLENLTIGVGHTSEHELNKKDERVESFDYVKVSYRIEFKN